MCCWNLFANILFRVFHQYSCVRLVCSFILSSLSGLKINVRLASQKQSRSFSSPPLSKEWKNIEIIHFLMIWRSPGEPAQPGTWEEELFKKVFHFFCDTVSTHRVCSSAINPLVYDFTENHPSRQEFQVCLHSAEKWFSYFSLFFVVFFGWFSVPVVLFRDVYLESVLPLTGSPKTLF